MKKISLTIIATIISTLIITVFAIAQPPKPRKNENQTAEANATFRRYNIIKSLKSVKVSRKVANAVRRTETLHKFFEVKGTTLMAKAGYLFANLENGKNILTNEDNARLPFLDTVETKVEWGVVVWVCKCAGSIQPGDDSCKFENKNPKNGGTCTGGTCCNKSGFWIEDSTGQNGPIHF